MEQISLSTLKTASSILTWTTFWFAIATAILGWVNAQVRSETGRRSDLRVATAQDSAAQASSIAAKANARAEALRGENLATEGRLVAAERALEAERVARIRLERSMEARRVSAVQLEVLKERLAGQNITAEGVITVSVFATTETAEARLFAVSLASAFDECQFTIHPHAVHYGTPYPSIGVGLLSSEMPEAVARGNYICEVLNGIGITASMLPLRRVLLNGEMTDGARLYYQSISLMVGDQPV